MSTQIQVLVLASQLSDTLSKIQRREKFNVRFNNGTYAPQQFAMLQIDSSEWELGPISVEPFTKLGNVDLNGKAMATADASYIAEVMPRTNPTPPERRLEPTL